MRKYQKLKKNQVNIIQTKLQKLNLIKINKFRNKYQNKFQVIHLIKKENLTKVLQKVNILKILRKPNQ